jgi:hypothetical protein
LCFARDCEAVLSTKKRNSLFIFVINIPIERKAGMKNLRKEKEEEKRIRLLVKELDGAEGSVW